MKKQMRMYLLALLLGNALSHAADEETIVFSTAPTHSTEVTVRLYSPLVSFLTRVTGKKVVIESADNFIEYSVRMRQGDYDILFDGPHLVGWRMAVLGHIPIARLPGTIKIVVVAREDSTVKTMQDLETGRNKVCTFASPNMLTMAFLSYYPHPARQPTLLRAQGFKELEQCVRSDRGDVAVLRDKLWNKMDQTGLRLIAAPERGYPERTFTISDKLDKDLRKQIAEAMLSEEGQKVLQAVMKQFKKDKLIKANPDDYAGLGSLLNTVWGFHAAIK